MGRKNSSDPNTSKRRVFFIELYPDSEVYNCDELLDVVRSFPEYAYILHDKDVKSDTGELKKPHYHCVIRVTPTLLSTIQNKFEGLDKRFIEYNHEFKWCLRYLVHLDDISKYQYSHDSVISNIDDIESYWRTSTEFALVNEMVALRLNGATWNKVFVFAGKNHCYDVFRRNIGIIDKICSETSALDFHFVDEHFD